MNKNVVMFAVLFFTRMSNTAEPHYHQNTFLCGCHPAAAVAAPNTLTSSEKSYFNSLKYKAKQISNVGRPDIVAEIDSQWHITTCGCR